MRRFIIFLAAAGCLICMAACTSNEKLPRANISAQNSFASFGDKVFGDVWGQACNELHSLMVVQDGKVLYERWENGHSPEEQHILWSASKTFTATAVGFAVQDGILRLDDRIVKFFTKDELPTNYSEWLEIMTVHDLLTMSSGFNGDCISRARSGDEFDWARETLNLDIAFRPGTEYSYNSMNTYLLSVIVSRVTGKKMADYLDEKFFGRLGIANFVWEKSPQGYNTGGWGLFLQTESLAKMGQFLLQKGEWKGKQLLEAKWIDEAFKPQIMQYAGLNVSEKQKEYYRENDDWNQGYGYQMWCCRHGAVRLDGAWGQLVVIMPDKNAIVVATSHTANTPMLLNSIWNNIYANLQ